MRVDSKVKKVIWTKEVGDKKIPKSQILTDDDNVFAMWGRPMVGDVVKGEVQPDRFGELMLKKDSQTPNQRASFNPEYLAKKNELNARQTALNNAVIFAAAKIEAGDKKITGNKVFKMAELNLKWLKGEKINGEKKETVVTANEELPEEEPKQEEEEDDEGEPYPEV